MVGVVSALSCEDFSGGTFFFILLYVLGVLRAQMDHLFFSLLFFRHFFYAFFFLIVLG